MTAHIHHTSRKTMATGSAWGRLMTIAFLCFLFSWTLLAGNTEAYDIELYNSGDAAGTVTIKEEGTPNPAIDVSLIPGVPQGLTVNATKLSITPIEDPASNLIKILLNAPDSRTLTGGFPTWFLEPVADNDQIEVTFDSKPQISISDAMPQDEGDTGTQTYSFTVNIDKALPTQDITFDWSTADDTTIADSDYVAVPNGTGTIIAGTTSTAVTVVVNGDQVVEGDESFTVNLSNAVGATILDGTATGTITDDDTAQLSISNVTQVEGDTGTQSFLFTVSLGSGVTSAGDIIFDWSTADDTATAPADYVAVPVTGAMLAAGNNSMTVTVVVNGDQVVEGDESFTVNLSNAVGATILDGTATGTITDDDTAQLSISNVTQVEGDTGTQSFLFAVSLGSGVTSAGDITFDWSTADDTATAPADYVAVPVTGAMLAAGNNSMTVTVVVNGDQVVEGDESFTVNLSNAVGATILDGTATGTITDDDTAQLSISNVTQVEGDTGTQSFLFTVSLGSGVTSAGDITFDWSTADDTATAPADYVAVPVTGAMLAAGNNSMTVTVVVNGDQVVEGDESFTVNLSNAVGATILDGTATGTITDDDTAQLSISNVTQVEGDTGTQSFLFAVSLGSGVTSAGDITFDWSTADDTATAPADYVAVPVTGAMLAAGNNSMTVTVVVNGDQVVEGDESFTVNLSNAVGATILDGTATGTITDDDTAQLSISNVTQVEGDTGTQSFLFTVSLGSGVTSAGDITFDWSTADDTATAPADYVAVPVTGAMLAAGNNSMTVTVVVNGDQVVEGDESFTVNLSNAVGATILDGTATGTITDDDTAQVSITNGSDGAEPNSNGYFTVSLGTGFSSDTDTVVSFTVNGTATNGNDYANIISSVTIPAGSNSATIDVMVTNDFLVEGSETVIVTLNSITSGNGGISIDGANSSATVTITDDDATTITISATDAIAAESNDNGLFAVSLGAGLTSSTDTVINLTVGGTATNGTDYAAIGTSVTIPAGSNSATIDVTVTNDTVVEGDETVMVMLDSVSSGNSGITIGGAKSATVTIADNDATLTVNVVSPLVTSSVSPSGMTSYDKGTVLALTASPGTGELFSGWSGDLTGSDNPATIVIDSNKTVTATFIRKTVTLTTQVVSLDGGGNVSPDAGSHSYLWGDDVTVSATPDGNSVFAGWSGSLIGTANPATITMNGDQTVTANFELKKFSVTFNAGAHGLVQEGTNSPTNSITQQVKWGQDSTVVSAVANEHYHFLNWTNAAGDIVATAADLHAENVTQDMEFTANFEIDKFSVTFKSSNYGGIEVAGTPPEYYEEDYTEIVDWGSNSKWVTARLDDYSQFRGWHGDYTSDDVTIQVTNVQQDMTVTYDTVPDINGCSTDVSAGYSGGFQATDFKRVNVDVDTVTGHMVLNTGNQAIDPNNIVIPFTQDVYVTFLYEGAGFQNSDFGYKFASEGKAGTKHQVYANINDNDNDGVLDGVGDRNLDGTIDRQDNKVFLGTIEGGTELVFYLDSTDNGCGAWCGDIFYTKREWNDHDAHARCTTGIGRLVKLFENGVEGDPTCYGYVAACGTGVHEQGWLNSVARTRLNSDFGFNFRAPVVGDPVGFNTKCIDELNGTASTHAIVGAPDETPFAWVVAFDDTTMDNPAKSNDYDYNDVVFLVERKTGGMAQLELANAIVPNEANAYFTAVTFNVWDFHPGGACEGKTHTTYYVSAEGGAAGSWIEITEWDKINVSDSSKTIGDEIDPATWTLGDPEYTYRSRRIDLAGLGRTGNQLLWKAELVSEDEDCAPRIVDVQLTADTASHGFFARSSPVVQTNVIYAGTYETPSAAFPADERLNRGHLTANLLYVPEDPNQTLVDNTATADIDETLVWDAGEVLKDRNPDTRAIKFPDVTVTAVPDATLTDGAGDPIQGDGVTMTFSGTLPNHPVVATTVRIHDSDNDESFTDEFTDDLKGSLTGTGTINRFTGEWTVTFTSAPHAGVQIMASYSHYTASSLLKEFNNANVTTDILALNNQMVNTRYIHDFNGDNNFGESDADWLVQWVRGYKQPNTSTQKAWKLGPIDHSTPALLVPPGYPLWYFGSQVTKAERDKYKEFKDALEERDSVLFVGSRDGMLHAFDAGKYRYGDNPETVGIEENRGYFLWEEKPTPAPDYCASYAGNCPNYGTGEELWAFIPANLLPRLKNNLLKADDQSFVDASPALSDVYIDTNSDGDSDTWRTVLLSAEGNGGDTVFCLDVTDPLNPTFMWEFAAPELFRSRSSPAVAQIGRIRDPNGTDAVKWVAFFVTGKVESSTLFPSIYMIDIADGSVLRKVVLDDPIDLDESGTIEGAEIDYGKGGVPSGQPAIVDSDENGYIDRLYVATDKGLMYKVNIPDDPKNPAAWDINHCVLNTDFTDADSNTIPSDQRLHPVYASPAIVVDNEITAGGDIAYKVMVFFGTGDNPYYDENINTATTRYHFFAYLDTNEKGESDPAKHNLDWFIELPAGNRIFASAFAAAGQIYFGTSTAETEDPCEGHLTPEGNEGRIYAVTLEGVILLNKVVGDIRTSPLVEDEHLYFRTPTGLQSLGSGIYNNEVQAAGEPTINIRSWREIIN